jgi:hypothetical protein
LSNVNIPTPSFLNPGSNPSITVGLYYYSVVYISNGNKLFKSISIIAT